MADKGAGMEKGKSIHAGHRERLRARLRAEGLASFSEHEVLELLLTYAIPQRDVNPLAHELIARFGSLGNVLEADETELLRVKGVGGHAALLLSMIPQLTRYYQMNTLGEKPIVMNLAQARAYCVPLFVGAQQEHLYMLCMDRSGHVLHLALMHTGTVDEVSLYPRLVVQTALRHNAHSVLLTHNHPSGTMEPSQADIVATNRATAALATVGITLADHLIYSRNGVFSITRGRECGDPEGDEAFSYVMPRGSGSLGALRDEGNEWIACPETAIPGGNSREG